MNEIPGRRPREVSAKGKRAGIALEQHRHNVRINDRGVHLCWMREGWMREGWMREGWLREGWLREG